MQKKIFPLIVSSSLIIPKVVFSTERSFQTGRLLHICHFFEYTTTIAKGGVQLFMRRQKSVNLSGDYQRISKLDRHYFKNEIYFTRELTPELLSMTRMHLPNLSDFYLEEDRAVFISPILEGVTLLQLEGSSSEKVELINSYLNIVREFEPLPLFMQLNLMRPENFYMVHGELKHRGILIVEDVDFDYLPSPSQMRRNISKVMLEIIGKDVSLFNFKNYFRNLPNNTSIQHVEQIVQDVTDIYINDLFVEKKFQAEETKVVTSAWGYINVKFVVLAFAFLFFIGSAFFAFYKSLSFRETQGLHASFVIEKRDSSFLLLDTSFAPTGTFLMGKKWSLYKDNKLLYEGDSEILNYTSTESGTFRAVLQVQDSKENWSAPYTQTFQFVPHTVARDDIEYYAWSQAEYKEGVSKSGPKSLLFEADSVAHLEAIYLEGSVSLHFFVRSDSNRQEKIRFEGFNSGSRVVLREENIYVPQTGWKEISIEIDSPLIDSLKISFPMTNSPVYIDELQINSMS